MGWVVFIVVFIFIVYRFFWTNNHQCDRGNQNAFNHSAGKKETDDFAGGSVGALFLMEEFIDPGIDEQESAKQGLVQSEQLEDDFFEEEFFE